MFDRHHLCAIMLISVCDLHPNIKINILIHFRIIVTKMLFNVDQGKMLKMLYTDFVVHVRYLFSSTVLYCPLVLACMHASCFGLTWQAV